MMRKHTHKKTYILLYTYKANYWIIEWEILIFDNGEDFFNFMFFCETILDEFFSFLFVKQEENILKSPHSWWIKNSWIITNI